VGRAGPIGHQGKNICRLAATVNVRGPRAATLPSAATWPKIAGMCRNITTLRGLDPPATEEEIEAAARQYIRKVSGITHPTAASDEVFEQAVAQITRATAEVLRSLPPRRKPPKNLPPLRRPEVRARLSGGSGR
jgi:hypothetical protein